MNKKGTRNTNGEGGIYPIISKTDRKKNRKDFVCDICKNCSDWSVCNYRQGTNKCQKCVDCSDCLKPRFCDRFYCYAYNQAQISVNGTQTTVANEKKRKDAIIKKKETEVEVQTNSYIRKNNVTLLTLVKNAEKRNTKIKDNTKGRNKREYTIIEESTLNQKPFQQLTEDDIRDFLESKKYLSQSEIDKIYRKIKIGCDEAVDEDICTIKTNPCRRISPPDSLKDVKDIIPFELDEFHKLITYILTHNLVANKKCNCDSNTIRNIILLTFLTLTRIGETLAYNYEKHIDFKKQKLIVDATLSRDEDNKIIMGETPKTGYSGKGKLDFDIFDAEIVELILKNQIEIASNNIYNKEKLLFCTKDGKYISNNSITNIFKRICRQAGVKLDLITGCHMHMTRHTGVAFLIEMGYDLYFISKITRHTSTKEIEKTYGHILDEYMKKKLKDPNYKLIIEDIITPEIKQLALEVYKNNS